MRDITTPTQGTTLRLKVDYRCFLPLTPYDFRCDRSKKGTGFLMSFEGKKVIVTAHHVISQAVSITATTPSLTDGEAKELRVLGMNPYLDIAILEGPPSIMELPAFRVGLSSNLAPEMRVTAIGFANGTLRVHTTTGTISGRNDYPHNRIQTDATINPGNSGGPVVYGDRIIGIVTSGMNWMQATNFFTPIDEAMLSIKRMQKRSYDFKGIGVDLGFHLNAAMRSVDAAACNGLPGGALVACTQPGTGLEKGDVIRQVMCPRTKTYVPLNAFMRVNCPKIWSHDSLDFRSLLDAIDDTSMSHKWPVVLRRGEQEIKTNVDLGPNLIESREMFPDCESISYVTFGGLVVQMLNSNQVGDLPGMTRSCMSNPDTELFSKPVITHTSSGCPYNVHGAARLPGRTITALIGDDGVERNVKNIKEVFDVIRAMVPRQIVLDSGDRVGTSELRYNTFVNANQDESLESGMHNIINSKRIKVTYLPSTLENLKRIAESTGLERAPELIIDDEEEEVLPPEVPPTEGQIADAPAEEVAEEVADAPVEEVAAPAETTNVLEPLAESVPEASGRRISD